MNNELERTIIGSMVQYPDLIIEYAGTLRSEWFTDPQCRTVLSTMLRLQAEGQTVDTILLAQQLGAQPSGSSPQQWIIWLSEVMNTVSSTAYFREHVQLLRQLWMRRRVKEIGQAITRSGDAEDISDIIQRAEDSLYAVGESGIEREATQISEDVNQTLQRINTACESNLPIRGIATGFRRLDSMLLGLQPSDLIIIAARPSQGKTALAVTMARHISNTECHHPVAFFSLEMGREQIVNRLLMQSSGIEGNKIRTGIMAPDEQARIAHAGECIRQQPFYIDDTPALTVQQLRTKARKLVRRCGVKVIFIDYLQLMKTEVNRNASRENEVSAISRALKCLAKELQVPVVALAQLNREGERGMEIREPRLSDLRESGAIEQDADVVIMLHKPKMGLADERELIVAKHRNGATGSVVVKWNAPTALFYDNQTLFDTR